MRELQYGLALLELAFEEGEALAHAAEGFTWTDDGVRRCDLMQANGEPLLTLKISEKESAPS